MEFWSGDRELRCDSVQLAAWCWFISDYCCKQVLGGQPSAVIFPLMIRVVASWLP